MVLTAALEEYRKQTKKDIASHPVAAQLKSCDSPSAILTVLRAQVQAFDKSDEKLTKWLDPTVNVLHAFSAILGDTIGQVITSISAVRDLRIYPLTGVTGIPTLKCDFRWNWHSPPSEYLS